jgi:DNA-binding transcriptional ArsR family regulator
MLLDLYKPPRNYRPVHAFDILGDPVRRRILELLAAGEQSAGELGAVVQAEFGISQPAVSQHLRVLRDSGFATVRPDGSRRLYAVSSGPLQELDEWVAQFRGFWEQGLDALGTELHRGQREGGAHAPTSTRTGPAPMTEQHEDRTSTRTEQHGDTPAPGPTSTRTDQHQE